MKRWFPVLLIAFLLIAGCLPKTPPPTPVTPTPIENWGTTPVISAMQAGAQGNNNAEFIELYNPTRQPVDLQGWALWYQLKNDSEPQLVYRWRAHVVLAPHGYLLLVREGQDFGLRPDAAFQTALNLKYGGLQLRQRDGAPIDSLGWGSKAPADFLEGRAAAAPANGQALVRKPDDGQGNWYDSNLNANDFIPVDGFTPRNSAAALTPSFAPGLTLSVEAPQTIAPGETLTYQIHLKNMAATTLTGIHVHFNPPAELKLLEASGAENDQGALTWRVDSLDSAAGANFTVTMQVPWRYFTIQAPGAYASADNWDGFAFSPPTITEISGGSVPIATARSLKDSELTIEGVATMYTGGLYAGSGNTKFYLQDESGGIQVQVFGGDGLVDVQIGDHVRVQGVIGAYRGALQIVPQSVPDDVTVLSTPYEGQIQPQAIAISDYNSEDLEGLLLQVEGVITRVQEYSYNYEIDLADEAQNIITLYIDKQTPIVMDTFQVGQHLRAIGILEERDDLRKLYPRVQSDLQEIYPPGLRIQIDAPLNAENGDEIEITLTVYNDYPEARQNLTLTLPVPDGLTVKGIGEGGQQNNNVITWQIPSLDGHSASAQVHASFQIAADTSAPIILQNYSVQAEDDEAPTEGLTRYLFIGDSLPIWAIQGSGDRSPYVGEIVTTRGIVTAVFPALGGFWIQSETPDDNPLTSEGLFVQQPAGAAQIPVRSGEVIRLSGKVREIYQQTTLELASFKNVEVLEDSDLPTAIALDPPADEADAITYYERLEGMLVKVDKAIAVSPSNRYGETSLVLPSHPHPHLPRQDENGFIITCDDGASAAYDYQNQMPWVIMPGDTVYDISGPLAYTYGQYKIEPLAPPRVEPIEHPLPVLQPAGKDEFSIMTWNAENFFDTQLPNPSSPPMPSASEYALWLRKAAATIAAAGNPTVVALQEIENIGVLEDIASQELLHGYDYQAYLIEGNDSRGIDVGYLVRGDQAAVLDVTQRNAPEGLTSRPPLVLHLQIGEGEVYIINNHFTSMSGGEALTEPRRLAQAQWTMQIVQGILDENPQARIAVLGDLNSYYDSPPLDVFRQGGLRHVFEKVSAKERYTYIYHGETQSLDHILVSEALWRDLRRVEILHVNADWPPPDPDDASPRRKSDHDPVIAIFKR